MATKDLTRADYVGLAEIKKARERNTKAMFDGTQLKFGAKSMASTIKSLKDKTQALKKSASGSSAVAKGASAAKSTGTALPSVLTDQIKAFFAQCADVVDIDELAVVIGAQTLADLVAEATPILGVLVSGGKLVKAGAIVAQDGYNLYQYDKYKQGFLSGDPVAAADAVKKIIERDLAKHSVVLAQQATATGLKIAGLFADFGAGTTAAVGIATAASTLGLELVGLGIEIKEMRAGNNLLKHTDTLSIKIFNECPILGCYLLTCSDTSAVANLFVADIGLPGWMDKVETLKKTRMDPLLTIATKAIGQSRLQLENLATNKGTHEVPGYFAKKKKGLMNFLGIG